MGQSFLRSAWPVNFTLSFARLIRFRASNSCVTTWRWFEAHSQKKTVHKDENQKLTAARQRLYTGRLIKIRTWRTVC